MNIQPWLVFGSLVSGLGSSFALKAHIDGSSRNNDNVPPYLLLGLLLSALIFAFLNYVDQSFVQRILELSGRTGEDAQMIVLMLWFGLIIVVVSMVGVANSRKQ